MRGGELAVSLGLGMEFFECGVVAFDVVTVGGSRVRVHARYYRAGVGGWTGMLSLVRGD